MHISGAKFEEHCSNISRDNVDWVLYCFSGTMYDVITFLICIIQKHKYLYNEKRYFKKEKPIFLYFEKPFKWAAIIFLLHGTLGAVIPNTYCTYKHPWFSLDVTGETVYYKCEEQGYR